MTTTTITLKAMKIQQQLKRGQKELKESIAHTHTKFKHLIKPKSFNII